MPPAGFELTSSASERPQTHALERATTEIGSCNAYKLGYKIKYNKIIK
jgi:hypothetical protein